MWPACSFGRRNWQSDQDAACLNVGRANTCRHRPRGQGSVRAGLVIPSTGTRELVPGNKVCINHAPTTNSANFLRA